jgi:hypothetical protein
MGGYEMNFEGIGFKGADWSLMIQNSGRRSHECRQFLDYLREYKLLNKGSAP